MMMDVDVSTMINKASLNKFEIFVMSHNFNTTITEKIEKKEERDTDGLLY